MKIECHGESRLAAGRELAGSILIDDSAIPLIALCEADSRPGRSGRRVLDRFQHLFSEAEPTEIGRFSTWAHWMGVLDFALLRHSHSAFGAAAVVDDRVIGTTVGSCRACLFDGNGNTRIFTGDRERSLSSLRLGTGDAKVSPIDIALKPQDLLLLLSESAWSPLGLSHLRRIVAGAQFGHVSAVPAAIIAAASGRVEPDREITVVALQRVE